MSGAFQRESIYRTLEAKPKIPCPTELDVLPPQDPCSRAPWATAGAGAKPGSVDDVRKKQRKGSREIRLILILRHDGGLQQLCHLSIVVRLLL